MKGKKPHGSLVGIEIIHLILCCLLELHFQGECCPSGFWVDALLLSDGNRAGPFP